MANKRTREESIRREQERIRQEKEQGAKKLYAGLKYYSIAALVGTMAILLLFLGNWVYIYNTDIGGSEVAISGFDCFFAGLTGNYTSTDKLYGDMAVPFYYYAASDCIDLSVITVVSMALLVLLLISQLVTVVSRKYVGHLISLFLGLLLAVMLIVCFIMALGMGDSKILSIYCSGNPACSIRSLAIVPALVALGVTLLHGVAAFKHYDMSALLK